MKQKSFNHLLHSVSSQSTNKFKSIMNSPNFGNQQILLQSCCFFDSERSQTPHASNTIIKDFSINHKNKSGSPKVPHDKDIKKRGLISKKNSNKLIPNKEKIKRSNTEESGQKKEEKKIIPEKKSFSDSDSMSSESSISN